MSLRPSAIAEEQAGLCGLYVVIDDPDTAGVLLIPCSFEHRRVLAREQYEEKGRFEIHPPQPSPDPSDRDRGLVERFVEEIREEAATLRSQASDSEERASLDDLSAEEVMGEKCAAHALTVAACRLSGALERLDGKQMAAPTSSEEGAEG